MYPWLYKSAHCFLMSPCFINVDVITLQLLCISETTAFCTCVLFMAFFRLCIFRCLHASSITLQLQLRLYSSICTFFQRVWHKMFCKWHCHKVCASPINSTCFTRHFLLVKGWGLGTRLGSWTICWWSLSSVQTSDASFKMEHFTLYRGESCVKPAHHKAPCLTVEYIPTWFHNGLKELQLMIVSTCRT